MADPQMVISLIIGVSVAPSPAPKPNTKITAKYSPAFLSSGILWYSTNLENAWVQLLTLTMIIVLA